MPCIPLSTGRPRVTSPAVVPPCLVTLHTQPDAPFTPAVLWELDSRRAVGRGSGIRGLSLDFVSIFLLRAERCCVVCS